MTKASKNNEQLLTGDIVHGLFSYDPTTGILIRKINVTYFAKTGQEAGWLDSSGYRRLEIKGKPYLVHRLAWFMTYGTWPEHQIDHVNGLRSDNRLLNLREATVFDNTRNAALRKDNSKGVKGVRKTGNLWYARIQVNGVNHSYGGFADIESAKTAYATAAKLYFGEFARLV